MTVKNQNENLGQGVGFERIRRITGYLVGTMDKWNDAKRAEERDRVKHSGHKDLLKKSVEYLNSALNEVNIGQPIDIISIYIKKATKTLGEVIGADVSEEVVHKIFEKFCLGK